MRFGKCLVEHSCEDILQREVKTGVTCARDRNDARTVVENIKLVNNSHSGARLKYKREDYVDRGPLLGIDS